MTEKKMANQEQYLRFRCQPLPPQGYCYDGVFEKSVVYTSDDRFRAQTALHPLLIESYSLVCLSDSSLTSHCQLQSQRSKCYLFSDSSKSRKAIIYNVNEINVCMKEYNGKNESAEGLAENEPEMLSSQLSTEPALVVELWQAHEDWLACETKSFCYYMERIASPKENAMSLLNLPEIQSSMLCMWTIVRSRKDSDGVTKSTEGIKVAEIGLVTDSALSILHRGVCFEIRVSNTLPLHVLQFTFTMVYNAELIRAIRDIQAINKINQRSPLLRHPLAGPGKI